MILNCEWCGKEYDTRETKRRKYCSEECRIAAKKEYYKHYAKSYKFTPAQQQKRKWVKVMKKCVICGSEFLAGRSNQVCCSPQCAYEKKKQYATDYNRLYKVNRSKGKGRHNPVIIDEQPECVSKGIEYQFLTPEQKIFYGDTQMKAYADDFKVTIPEGLKKAKDRQSEKAAL